MAISEESRHHLYLRLEEVLGAEEAAVLMEHLPPVGWRDVASKRDIDALAATINLRFDSLEFATRHGFAYVGHEFAYVGHEFADVRREIADVRHEIARLATREDVADLRTDIERELRGLSWRFIGVLIAATSLVLAGLKL